MNKNFNKPTLITVLLLALAICLSGQSIDTDSRGFGVSNLMAEDDTIGIIEVNGTIQNTTIDITGDDDGIIESPVTTSGNSIILKRSTASFPSSTGCDTQCGIGSINCPEICDLAGISSPIKCYKFNVKLDNGENQDYVLCLYNESISLTLSYNENEQSSPFTCNSPTDCNPTDIQITATPTGNYDWSIEPNDIGLGIAPSGNTSQVSITCTNTPCFSSDINKTVTVTAENSNGETASIDFKIEHEADSSEGPPSGVDIVYVIDISGSMDNPAKGCAKIGEKTKLGYLKDKFWSLLKSLETLNVNGGGVSDNNRYGFVFFNQTAKKFSEINRVDRGFDDLEELNETSIKFIRDNFLKNDDKISASGSTSVGSGILKAYDILASRGGDKPGAIIVFSNGMQNEAPLIKKNNGEVYIDAEPDLLINNNNFKDKNIYLKMINWYGPNQTYLDALSHIGSENITVKKICEASLSIEDFSINSLLPNGSPKFIKRPQMVKINGTRHSIDFKIQEELDKIIVRMGSVENQNMTITITKDGEPITGKGEIIPPLSSTSPYRVFVLKNNIDGSFYDLKGNYNIQVNSSLSNILMDYSVIGDDRGLRYNNYIQAIKPKAGNPVRLTSSLFFAGQAVDSIDEIRAIIKRPKHSYGKAIAQTKLPSKYKKRYRNKEDKIIDLPFNVVLKKNKQTTVRGLSLTLKSNRNLRYIKRYNITAPEGQTFEPGLSNGQKKYQTAYYTTDLLNKLSSTITDTITLLPIKEYKNAYSTQYRPTQKMGIYEVEYQVNGFEDNIGHFIRSEVKSFNVGFGKAQFDKSKVKIHSENIYILTFRPQDRYGNCLGPGNAKDIKVFATVGVASTTYDYLDGTYAVRLVNTPLGKKPKVVIKVQDEILYNDQLVKLMRKFKFALQGGVSATTNDIGSSFSDLNATGEAKFGYRIWNHLFLQAEGGYYKTKNSSDGSEPKVVGGGLGLQYNFPLGFATGWNLYVDGTLGQYKLDNSSFEWGANGGLGLSYTITPNLAGVIEGGYYSIFRQPDSHDFINLSLGLRSSF